MSTTIRTLGNGRRMPRRRARGGALHAVAAPRGSGRNDRMARRARIRLVARPAQKVPAPPRKLLRLVFSNPAPIPADPRRTEVRPALRLVAPGERAPRANPLGRILWSIERWQPAWGVQALIVAAIAIAGAATIATSARQLLSRAGLWPPTATL